MKKTSLFFLLLSIVSISYGQKDFYKNYPFTTADSLRGALRPERTCFDVTFYNLNITVDPEQRTIEGYNDIHYTIINDFKKLQIDLFQNLEITSIKHQGKTLKFDRIHDAVFVNFETTQPQGKKDFIRVYYNGKPQVAKSPPWDGGFVWSKDEQQKHWIGVACEGDGASLWWPNKDHLSDEPDSMLIQCAVPSDLVCVSNGNQRSKKNLKNGYTRYDWFVSYPIDNYNVTLNIADYAHFSETYISKTDGSKLACDYYVLKNNLEKAKKHFAQTGGVLESYEHFFGKYPFWNDGFAMVETPYLGMEHQGAIAYGNHYKNGYLGTGGLNQNGVKADYIIVHETGHEYFGNSISCYDLAEMWIQESFTTYMETLYVEYIYGKEKALTYINTQRRFFNKEPIVGPLDVNFEDWAGGDHYYKGAWMLHTLRSVLDDDPLFFDILKSFHIDNQISNVKTSDFVNHVNQKTGKDFSKFFEQYLTYPSIPTLEYKIKKKGKGSVVQYRLKTDVQGLEMPVKIGKRGDYTIVNATATWQEIRFKSLPTNEFVVGREYYLINRRKITN